MRKRAGVDGGSATDTRANRRLQRSSGGHRFHARHRQLGTAVHTLIHIVEIGVEPENSHEHMVLAAWTTVTGIPHAGQRRLHQLLKCLRFGRVVVSIIFGDPHFSPAKWRRRPARRRSSNRSSATRRSPPHTRHIPKTATDVGALPDLLDVDAHPREYSSPKLVVILNCL